MDEVLQDSKELICRSQSKDEFHFVMTLINYRGMGDTYETSNLYEWFEAIEDYKITYHGMTWKTKNKSGLSFVFNIF